MIAWLRAFWLRVSCEHHHEQMIGFTTVDVWGESYKAKEYRCTRCGRTRAEKVSE